VDVLSHVPNLIYSSDLGQTNQMDINTWMTFSNNLFDELQIKPERKDDICRNNAVRMLTIY